MPSWYEGDINGPKNWDAVSEPELKKGVRDAVPKRETPTFAEDVFHHQEKVLCAPTVWCPTCDLERKRPKFVDVEELRKMLEKLPRKLGLPSALPTPPLVETRADGTLNLTVVNDVQCARCLCAFSMHPDGGSCCRFGCECHEFLSAENLWLGP